MIKRALTLVFLATTCVCILRGSDTLVSGFKNPPPSAKARTWWHWLNGNITREGITADLEAMKRVGIQEAQILNVGLGLPAGPASYLNPEWLDLLEYAALEARRLGLELGFHNGPGWSSSGGPWITPEHAMQTVVYSELIIEGGETEILLHQPETNLDYYRDIAVLAFPQPLSDVRIDKLDYKSLSGRIRNHLEPDSKPIPQSAIINKADIIDLTAKLSPEGILQWKVPEGEWVILRLGHTPTGKMNKPAPMGGHGLECDKMNGKAVDAYWEGGVKPIIEKLGTLAGSVVTNCLIDSYEVGCTNWTAGFEKEFKQLRGYDCLSYLPTLAGYYVNSGEISERFLWDFRRTIGDLIAENYYAYFRELCHRHGMILSIEPYWGPFDNMQVGASGDIVMSEFWSGSPAFFDSPKFVASIAKLNSSSIVGAEAFTDKGGWMHHPASLKSIGDRAWTQGVNRFVFHTYVHQPWDVGPGLALTRFGTEFNRLNTWWEQGKAFMDYIGRSQYLLQQGQSVSDVLVFTGESSPNDALLIPAIKTMGYDYDLIGANKLGVLTVRDGMICIPGGAEYRVLVLPETSWITPGILDKIRELVEKGAKVLGPKPRKSPSLRNHPECDDRVRQLSEELWDMGLIEDGSVIQFLLNDTISPDFEVENGRGAGIEFIHRKGKDYDIYFVANSRNEYSRELCRFRVSGRQPEFWNPETGEITFAPVWKDNGDGTTSIPLPLDPEGSIFVVFKKPCNASEHIENISMDLNGRVDAPLPDLNIIKAEYGAFLPEGLIDITGEVSEKVQNNQLHLLANRNLCACDPAQGYIKELRIEYMIGNKTFKAYAREGEPLVIDAGDRGELRIRKAVYGKFERGVPGIPTHDPVIDVMGKISGMVDANVLEIPVDNTLVDGLLAEGHQKKLRIVYRSQGELFKVLVPEGHKLNLAQNTPEPIIQFKEGKVIWATPYAGKMTYTTSSGNTHTLQVKSVPDPLELKGPWEVSFPNTPCDPLSATFDTLVSWSTSSEEAIRYFSGTASYKKQFTLPESFFRSGSSLELDLGSVHVIAELLVNGEKLGILWKEPFRFYLDGHVHEGLNTLEVKITNLWPNRLIGDEQFPEDVEREGMSIKEWPDWLVKETKRSSGRVTFSGYKNYDKDTGLLPSGLLGPVVIRPYVNVQLDK